MKIAITGLGCVTALGGGVEATCRAWWDGKVGIGGLGPFPGRGPVAAIPGGPHRSSTLALAAVREALGGRGVEGLGLVGGTTSGDMVVGEEEYRAWRAGEPVGNGFLWAQLADRPTQLVARALGLTGPRLSVSTACSSGASAVGVAIHWLRSGRASAVIAFGTDALCRMTVHGFGCLGAISPTGARPFAPDRDGLSLGEGAGALLLEPEGLARARGATIHGYIQGFGSASDGWSMVAPHPGGRGAREAMRRAGLDGVDWVSAHGTATALNDAMEEQVLDDLLPGVPVSAMKGAVGHTLGAAGAVELVAAAWALRPDVGAPPLVRGECAGPIREALSVSFAFGGHNVAVRVGREGRSWAPVERPRGRVAASRVLVPGGWDGLADDLRAGRGRGVELPDPVRPSTIPFGRWRRMSRLSRLVALAVEPLLERVESRERVPLLVGSAMGEVVPSSAFLDRILLEGPERGSPLAFQHSVYNATAAQLSLCFGLRGPSETLSAGMMTGLATLARGLEWLVEEQQVLIVLADDRNPTTTQAYGDLRYGEAVAALLLERGGDVVVRNGCAKTHFGRGSALPYEETFSPVGVPAEVSFGLHPANGLIAWLATGAPSAELDDGAVLTVTGTPG